MMVATGKIRREVDDNWINATDILVLAGKSKTEQKTILNNTVRKGLTELLRARGAFGPVLGFLGSEAETSRERGVCWEPLHL